VLALVSLIVLTYLEGRRCHADATGAIGWPARRRRAQGVTSAWSVRRMSVLRPACVPRYW
jgi:hypothetical protein